MDLSLTLIIPAPLEGEVEALKSAAGQDLKAEVCRGTNPPQNRNNGIKLTGTALVGFVNAHTILENSWAKRAKKVFADYPDISVLGGPQLTLPDERSFARASGMALAEGFATGAMSQRYKKGKFTIGVDESWLTSANLVCKREVFDTVRFDERIYPGEDPKFLADAKKAGFVLAFDPELVVYNRRRPSAKALAKQIFEYGRTRIQKDGASVLLKKPAFAGPPGFLIYLVLLLLIAPVFPIMLVPLGAYALLSLLISIKAGIQNADLQAAALLPWIFLIIHASYGAGIIYGVIRHGGRSLKNS